MSKQWVQHISGQGEKWEVRDGVDSEQQWCVWDHQSDSGYHWLPKSEYRLCPAPEVWEEVKVQIVERPHAKDARDPGGIYDGAKKLAQLQCGGAYRIKTLIVEKKVSE